MHWLARESEFQRRQQRGPREIAPWLAVALALAAADARAQIEVEVLSTTIDAGTLESIYVECPPGEVAIGGGTQVSDDGGIDLTGSAPRFGDTALPLLPDGPAGAPTGWEGSAANESEEAGTIHVGVLCAPGAAVSTVVASVAVESTFAGVTAECPEDTVAIGGGVAIVGGVALGALALRITQTGPRLPQTGALAGAPEGVHEAPDAWTVFVRNPAGGTSIVKVAAVCADLSDVSTHVAARLTEPGGQAGGEVDCPEGATALAGGIASGNPVGITVTSSSPRFLGDEPELVQQPDGTNPASIGWAPRGRNDSEEVMSVKRAAICVPEPGGVSAAVAAFAVLAGAARIRRVAS